MDDLVAYYLPPQATSHLSYHQQQPIKTRFVRCSLQDSLMTSKLVRFTICFVNSQDTSPVTFVALLPLKHSLLDQPSALAALHALHGMVFDLEKSNSRSKRSRIPDDDDKYGSDKRAKGSFSNSSAVSDSGVGSVHVSGLSNTAYNMIAYPPAQSYGSFDVRTENTSARSRNSSAPCPTIFVANLGPACTEQELTQVFSRCRGFLKLKIQSTYGTPVAFVDFSDTACSSEALNHLQGTVLHSSVAGEGMRLEFAKSRMGMRSKKSR